MFSLSLLLLVLFVAGSTASLRLSIQRGELQNYVARDRDRMHRRQLAQPLDNFESLYFANITLGTPPQSLRVHVDTGSSDLWCNSDQSYLCRSRFRNCEVSGTYNPNASTTSKFVNDDFQISYQDGTGAFGDYVIDTIGIAGERIPNLQFGLGARSTSTEGVLGIGYPINEVQVNLGQGDPYPNLPQLMVRRGLIETNAYSLWLNDLDANTGEILFGGVNTKKYHGALKTLPVLKMDEGHSQLAIALSGISVDDKELLWPSPNLPSAVLLDSGTTLMYLPSTVTEALYEEVGAVTDYVGGTVLSFVPCDLARQNKTIDFSFSGVQISVPFNELVLYPNAPDGSSAADTQVFSDGTPACVFGVAVSSSSSRNLAVLGDTFLRSAYVVYDLDNDQISLAQTKFNSTADDIEEIEAGPGGVPDAVMVADPIRRIGGITARKGGAAGPGPSLPTSTAGTALEQRVVSSLEDSSSSLPSAAEVGADLLNTWRLTAMTMIMMAMLV